LIVRELNLAIAKLAPAFDFRAHKFSSFGEIRSSRFTGALDVASGVLAVSNTFTRSISPRVRQIEFSGATEFFRRRRVRLRSLRRDKERLASRFHERLGAIAIETFTGGKGFGGKAAMLGRFQAQHKLAAEFFRGQRFGQFVTVGVNQFNHFLNGLTKLGVHFRFVTAVNAARHDFRAAANEALILVAPLHKFRVARGLFFDLLACHNSTRFRGVQCAAHVAFLIMLGVIARAATDRHPQPLRMRKVPMASLAAPVYKPGLFQVGNQLSHFARHFSIKIVSQRFASVKANGNVRRGFDSLRPLH